jgi:hypothetical protein
MAIDDMATLGALAPDHRIQAGEAAPFARAFEFVDVIGLDEADSELFSKGRGRKQPGDCGEKGEIKEDFMIGRLSRRETGGPLERIPPLRAMYLK